jgi:transforming growth factor-beta-induced protein
MKQIKLIFISIICILFLQACGSDDNDDFTIVVPTPVSNTIVDVAVADGRFTILVTALQTTGLDATLADTSKSFTVFAPTDDAFNLLGTETIDALLADTDTLSSILTYHVLGNAVDASSAIGLAGSKVLTANDKSIALSLDDNDLLINVSTVIDPDVMADNGIIHVIDAVLMPPKDITLSDKNIVETAIADPDGRFTTLVTALQATELDAVLADETKVYTVFAPTNDAFSLIGQENIDNLLANTDILADILLQHVLPIPADSITAYIFNGKPVLTASGAEVIVKINAETDMLTFGGANIIIKDIYTSNGIIHVIDAVIVGDVALPESPMTITDVAAGNEDFSILVSALQATGLDSVLADMEGNYTVFAPTNTAFDKLPEGTLDALLQDTDALSNILLYHVYASGTVLADSAIAIAQSDASVIEMTNMSQLALSFNDSTLFANGSRIVMADQMASNGVIHVIDNIILPPAMKGEPTGTIVDVVSGNEDFSTLVTALSAAGLVDTLADENASYTVFAPTNDAFEKIPADVLNNLITDVPALTAVLLQHVVNDKVDAITAYAANGTSIPTLAENNIEIEIDPVSGMLMFGGSMVTVTNIYTTNGIIHVIDTVVTD